MRHLLVGMCVLAGYGSTSVEQLLGTYCDWAVRCTGATAEVETSCHASIDRAVLGSGYSINGAIASGQHGLHVVSRYGELWRAL